MGSYFGKEIHISIFGQSHAECIGVTIDGLPAGEAVDEEALRAFMLRRAPGRSAESTARREADEPHIICGLHNGRTCGAPLTAIIKNGDTRSKDYDKLRDLPRPGHADLTAEIKYRGFQDGRGGGHFSGRITVALVAAGVVAKKILRERVSFTTRLTEVGGCTDPARFEEVIIAARDDRDSVGGIVECCVEGLPGALGEPFFDSAESMIAHVLFAIPAVKGVEFGAGFASARLHGSENNDPIVDAEGHTSTNHDGGINGGITNGNEIVVRVAIKPTPSISRPQQTYDFAAGIVEELTIHGRHDACIALRAVVVVEAVAAIALADLSLTARGRA